MIRWCRLPGWGEHGQQSHCFTKRPSRTGLRCRPPTWTACSMNVSWEIPRRPSGGGTAWSSQLRYIRRIQRSQGWAGSYPRGCYVFLTCGRWRHFSFSWHPTRRSANWVRTSTPRKRTKTSPASTTWSRTWTASTPSCWPTQSQELPLRLAHHQTPPRRQLWGQTLRSLQRCRWMSARLTGSGPRGRAIRCTPHWIPPVGSEPSGVSTALAPVPNNKTGPPATSPSKLIIGKSINGKRVAKMMKDGTTLCQGYQRGDCKQKGECPQGPIGVESSPKGIEYVVRLGMGPTRAGPTLRSEGAPKRRRLPLLGSISHLCRHNHPLQQTLWVGRVHWSARRCYGVDGGCCQLTSSWTLLMTSAIQLGRHCCVSNYRMPTASWLHWIARPNPGHGRFHCTSAMADPALNRCDPMNTRRASQGCILETKPECCVTTRQRDLSWKRSRPWCSVEAPPLGRILDEAFIGSYPRRRGWWTPVSTGRRSTRPASSSQQGASIRSCATTSWRSVSGPGHYALTLMPVTNGSHGQSMASGYTLQKRRQNTQQGWPSLSHGAFLVGSMSGASGASCTSDATHGDSWSSRTLAGTTPTVIAQLGDGTTGHPVGLGATKPAGVSEDPQSGEGARSG